MRIRYSDSNNAVSVVELKENATAQELAIKLNLTAPNLAVSVSINNANVDLSTILNEDDLVKFYSFDDNIGKEVFWHTSAHVLAQAVLRIFPDAKPTIGPPIENGFYYDFANLPISEEDLDRIEKEMQVICNENFKSERHLISTKEEAIERFRNNPYKVQLIEGFDPKETLTAYSQGEYFDLCRGPHLYSLGKIKAMKVMKTSGAYWKGDSKNEMLTRIYGISFPDRKLLKDYLFKLEEAKKRDHKIIGPRLDLFSLHEEGPGMPFIHPKGMIIWHRLMEYWRNCHEKAGYVEIKTPVMLVKDLWERSGHWQNYREHMFVSSIDDREFAIKPMNCPGAMLYFKQKNHSYRDLPLKVAEVGQVHRFEHSGALSGLFRVRAFHQDDAHIFIKPSDIQSEISAMLSLFHEIYSTFGLEYDIALSTRPDKHTIGTDEEWNLATEGLKAALVNNGKHFEIHEGEGAFYGPKIDFRLHDALGRKWQCGTIQLDMALPMRFDLEYTTPDGTKARPVMLHRVVYGSIERFLGSLIELYAGKFPLWLSPSQIRIITVADRHVDYAKTLIQLFKSNNFCADLDESNESVAKKIREAQLSQYNYILTIGDQEVQNQTVSLRTRDNVVHGEVAPLLFLEKISKERELRALQSPFTNKQE